MENYFVCILSGNNPHKWSKLSDHAESYISHMETTQQQFTWHDTHIYQADKASRVNIICCFLMLGASLYGIDSVDPEIKKQEDPKKKKKQYAVKAVKYQCKTSYVGK